MSNSKKATRPTASGSKTRSSWTSYSAFILAAIGASVGLGNVWKFPYEVGAHNGGTFVWVYIVCVILVAFPLMLAELMVGRMGRGDTVQAVSNVSKQERRSSNWRIIAWLGVLSSFLIFSYYSVVASWVLFYIMSSLSGTFVEVPAEVVQNSFGALLRNTDQMLIWHTVFVLMVVLVLSRDIRLVLERVLLFLMPMFVGLLIWLCYYISGVGNFDQAFEFVFSFDWSLITPELIVSALTQALFSLSIGIGILMMYGSYLSSKQPLFSGAGVILISDTAIALVMALMIFSIVFAFDLSPDAGSGLIFESLPVAFSQLGENGVLVGTAFFLSLLMASLTSGFALLEPFIVFLMNNVGISRRIAAWIAGALAWSLGLLSVYSFSDLEFQFFYFGNEYQHSYFDFLNIVTTHVIMPITALLIALFAGWRIDQFDAKASLNIRFPFGFKIWLFCIKVVVPLIIAVVLIMVLFVPA